MKITKSMIGIFLLATILSACSEEKNQNSSAAENLYEEVQSAEIDHVHGMGYAGNQDELFIATHNGLMKYTDNTWYRISRNKHDYMGFQAVNDGFYSSGHPEPGSNLKNPLGLIQSTDSGKSIKKLAFYGETDFHNLAAGYNNHMIYVINDNPNSKLDNGLFYSADKGDTWKQSAMKGFSAKSIGNISAHPFKSNIVGISTDMGLYLSEDYGNQFKVISESLPITTSEFQENSATYFYIKADEVHLMRQELNSTQNAAEIPFPKKVNSQNPIVFIASNPKNNNEMTVITIENDIFQTTDMGVSWKSLMAE